MTRSNICRVAAFCGIGAALIALAVPVAGGLARPGYDHVSQYISELGETGSAHGPWVSFAGFLPTGLLALAFTLLAARVLSPSTLARIGWACFLGVAAGYIVPAFAPCDAGCPGSGSTSQRLHTLFGTLEYVGGSLGLLLLGVAFWPSPATRPLAGPSLAGSLFVLGSFLGMVFVTEWRGLFQRFAEATIFGWIVAVSLWLLSDAARAAGPISPRPRA